MSVNGINPSASNFPIDNTSATADTSAAADVPTLTSELFSGQAALADVLAGGEIGRGARGEGARLVQRALIDVGYDLGRWGADGDFGRTTERQLSSFQRANGLPASGRADAATLVALDAKLGPKGLKSSMLKNNATLVAVADGNGTIEKGARGEAAQLVQKALLNAGYDLGRWGADGAFGNGTAAVVRQFQSDNGLPANGVVDSKTLLALDAKLPTIKNDIVLVGMGDHAIHEVKDLQKRGADVLGITDSAAGDDKVTVKIDAQNVTLDLQEHGDVEKFVASMGYTGAKAVELESIIEDAGTDARDETALVMKAFHEAETGERKLERLVLSGHSVGSGVWGDSNGDFDMDLLKDICKSFPGAAGQIEDFMIAGCYSSSERHVATFREMMPNVKTVWAYGDSAPGSWTGAMIHNALWEEATRGSDPAAMNRNIAAGTRKGENVATWNAVDGYMADGELRELTAIRTDLERTGQYVESYFTGEATIQDTQYGPMRDHYRNVQELLGHPDLPAGERATLELERDTTIRTIFYDATVKGRFHEAHGDQIKAAYEALGLPPVDYSALSRKDGVAAIDAFRAAVEGNANPPAGAADALTLLQGLKDLHPSVVPNTWV